MKKDNNKGFSLIELIVTIAIIALVVSPFLRSFFLAMDINSDARRLQNASMVSQDIMEQFKANSIEDMIEKSKTIYEVTPTEDITTLEGDTSGKKYPVYQFDNWKIKGADGEEFYATIKLDPTPYVAASGSGKNYVNSMTTYQFSSLFGSDAIMIFKQYTDPDSDLESYCRATGEFTEAELKNLGPGTVKKSTSVEIVGDYDTTTKIYSYVISLNMKYTYGTKSVEVKKDIKKTYQGKEGHSIYLMLPAYDNATTTNGTDGEGNYYSTDELAVSYEFKAAEEYQPELSVYLAEQEIKNGVNDLKLTKFKSENIMIYDKSAEKPSKTTLYKYNNDNSKFFKVYTNIEKSVSDTAATNVIQGLTYSDKTDNTILYNITIDIRYGSADSDVLTTFTGSKED